MTYKHLNVFTSYSSYTTKELESSPNKLPLASARIISPEVSGRPDIPTKRETQ